MCRSRLQFVLLPPAIDLVDLAKAPGEHLTAARLRSSERAGHGRDAAPIL